MLGRMPIPCWQQQCFAVVEGSHREVIGVFDQILKPKLSAEGTWSQDFCPMAQVPDSLIIDKR